MQYFAWNLTNDGKLWKQLKDVSTVSGLLAQASFYDGDTLTRKVTVSELSTETPDSELFTLPDGESVI